MITYSTDRLSHTSHRTNCTAEIRVKALTPWFINEGTTFLRTEDEVVVKANMCRRHNTNFCCFEKAQNERDRTIPICQPKDCYVTHSYEIFQAPPPHPGRFLIDSRPVAASASCLLATGYLPTSLRDTASGTSTFARWTHRFNRGFITIRL